MRGHRSLVVSAVSALALSCGCAADSPGRSPSPSPALPGRTAAMTPSASAATPGGSLRVRVATYNVLGGANVSPGTKTVRAQGYGSELPLSVRMPVVSKKISMLDPDLIGIQENEGPAKLPIAYLRPAQPGYTFLFGDDADPIGFRTSRFTLVDSGLVSPDPTIGQCQASTAARPHCITWARLKDVPSGRGLLIVNTHAKAGDTLAIARSRAANATAIAALVARENTDRLPVIVVGDFNAASDETRPIYNAHLTTMHAAGLADTAQTTQRDNSDVPRASSANWFTATIDGKTYAKVIRREGFHIDYIWVPRAVTVTSWETLSGPDVGSVTIAGHTVPRWTGVMGSDHSPVCADVNLPS